MLKKFIGFLFTIIIICIIAAAAGYICIQRFFPLYHYEIIEKYSNEYNLDPALVCAIIKTESNFRTDVQSHKGASGLMQLMEETANWAADKSELDGYDYSKITEPETNIKLGCWLLNKLYTMYDDENAVIAAYNAGIGNVNKWLKDPMYSGDGIHLTTIPFKETADYVKKVELYQRIYDIRLKMRKTQG